jgi:hypothetical protein
VLLFGLAILLVNYRVLLWPQLRERRLLRQPPAHP